jgi:Protein  of unknown function (DUF3018)
MNDLSPSRQSKFAAYRARKKAAGLREVRRWVWDVNSPAFIEQLRLEGEVLKNSAGEKEALDFIDDALDASMRDHPY